MLTGTRAFRGEDVADTLAAVLRAEPNWTRCLLACRPPVVRLPQAVPAEGPEAAHSPTSRDVRLALEGAFETAAPQTTAVATSASSGRLAWMIAAGAAVRGRVALAIPALRHLRETPPPAPPETRTEIARPPPTSPAIVCALARRPADRVRRVGGWRVPPVAAVAGRRRRRSRWRAPRARPFRSGRPTAGPWASSPVARSSGSTSAAARRRHWRRPQRLRWDVERGGRHRVCAKLHDALAARVGHRGPGDRRDDARPAAAVGHVGPFFLPDGRRIPVLGVRRAGRRRDLPGCARREHPDPADARLQPRRVSARRTWRPVRRRRLAALGDGRPHSWRSGSTWTGRRSRETP